MKVHTITCEIDQFTVVTYISTNLRSIRYINILSHISGVCVPKEFYNMVHLKYVYFCEDSINSMRKNFLYNRCINFRYLMRSAILSSTYKLFTNTINPEDIYYHSNCIVCKRNIC